MSEDVPMGFTCNGLALGLGPPGPPGLARLGSPVIVIRARWSRTGTGVGHRNGTSPIWSADSLFAGRCGTCSTISTVGNSVPNSHGTIQHALPRRRGEKLTAYDDHLAVGRQSESSLYSPLLRTHRPTLQVQYSPTREAPSGASPRRQTTGTSVARPRRDVRNQGAPLATPRAKAGLLPPTIWYKDQPRGSSKG